MSDSTDTSSDDKVAQFLAFTGSADPSRAKSYLEMSGGDLQTAVSLYLEHQGGGGGLGGSGMMDSGLDSVGGGGGAPGGHGAGANAGFGGAAAAGGFDGASGFGGGAPSAMGDDIRAPDRTRTMRLMDFDYGGGGAAASSAAAALASSGMLGRQAAAMLGATLGIGIDDDPGAMMGAFASDALAVDRGGGGADRVGLGAAVDVREALNRVAAADAVASASSSAGTNVDDDSDGAGGGVGEGGGGGGSSLGRPSPPSSGGLMRTTNLAEMFAPPRHLIHTAGGFQGARNVARDARRWLLVNIQRDSNFACHALNRDVWRDELVENLVREGFIFWQSTDVSPDGATYAQRYGVHSYPHVGIIDPRTGRLVWKKEGWTQADPMTAEQFAEMAADFCSRHSFDRPPVAPKPTSAPSTSTSTASNGVGGSSGSAASAAKKRPVREMTEEEQLQEAIRASMQGNNVGEDSDDDVEQESDDEMVMDDDDDDDDDDDSGDEAAGAVYEEGEAEYSYEAADDDDEEEEEEEEAAPPASVAAAAVPPMAAREGPAKKNQEERKSEKVAPAPPPAAEESKLPLSFEDGLLALDVGDEPAGGDVARVQIRMPDGKRLVRKFRGDDTVRVIYAFVAQSGGEGSRPFELKAGFPPRNIRPKVDETIKGCGLAGEAITVRWTS